MKKIIAITSYENAHSEWQGVLYTLMVRRDALRASHNRIVKKFRSSSVH